MSRPRSPVNTEGGDAPGAQGARRAHTGRMQPTSNAAPDRYAGQRIFVVRREDYVYLVPFVEDDHTVFLKSIIPSRKATKQYLREGSDDET